MALPAAPSILIGAAVGGAASAAFQPVFEPARQKAWEGAPNRLLDPAALARLIAQGGVPLDRNAYDDANREGFGDDKLDALIYLERVVPGFGEAVRILRRNAAFADLFTHSLVKQGIDPRYFDGLTDLAHERLDPAVIALAIVRGIMADPVTADFPNGFLPVGPPTTEGNVKAFPVSALDTLDEAKAAGIDDLRLFVQTAIAGRPMGPEAAAAGVFRGILKPADYQRAIAEGDVRNEWAQAIFETARQIPSPSDYVRATIKGWIKTDELHAGAARHGMSTDDVDLLYLAAGRPAAPGQMATAVARGVDGPDGTPMDESQFLKGIRESDIRPEWGPMLWGIRFQYPSLFQLNRLVSDGAVAAATAAEWATKDRYAPEVVDALTRYWQTSKPSNPDPHVVKAQNQLWTSLHRSYLAHKTPTTTAHDTLTAIGVATSAQDEVLRLWNVERDLARKALTAKQIKDSTTPPLDTHAGKVAALINEGYDAADADIYLAE